jgi:hypothetical protein
LDAAYPTNGGKKLFFWLMEVAVQNSYILNSLDK